MSIAAVVTDGSYQMLAHETGLLSLVNLDCDSMAENLCLEGHHLIL